MNNIEKIEKYRKTHNLQEEIKVESISVNFLINRKPENYVRERSGRGNHFYNPKEAIMKDYRHECLLQLSNDQYNTIQDIIKTNNEFYTVEINATYFYPIPKGDSIKLSVLKDAGLINPVSRIDLDNYDKFLLDSLHEVLYDDDKHVVSINSTKKYSTSPRTEVHATVNKLIIL